MKKERHRDREEQKEKESIWGDDSKVKKQKHGEIHDHARPKSSRHARAGLVCGFLSHLGTDRVPCSFFGSVCLACSVGIRNDRTPPFSPLTELLLLACFSVQDPRHRGFIVDSFPILTLDSILHPDGHDGRIDGRIDGLTKRPCGIDRSVAVSRLLEYVRASLRPQGRMSAQHVPVQRSLVAAAGLGEVGIRERWDVREEHHAEESASFVPRNGPVRPCGARISFAVSLPPHRRRRILVCLAVTKDLGRHCAHGREEHRSQIALGSGYFIGDEEIDGFPFRFWKFFDG